MEQKTGLVSYVLMYDRRRAAHMIVLLTIAGVMEGFGIAAILPVLDTMVSADGTESGQIQEVLARVLGTVGLAPTLPVLLCLFVLMFFLKGVAYYFAMVTVGSVVAKVVMELRIRLLRAVTNAQWRHVLRYPSGFIGNAISNEAGRTGMAYQEFAGLISEAIQVMVYLGLVFLVSWQTGLAAIAAGLLILALLQGRVSASRIAGHDQVQLLRTILARLTDALPSLKPLKAMGREEYLLPRLEQDTEAFFHAQKREIASTELLYKAREPILMATLALGLWIILSFTSISSTAIMILAALFYRSVTSITNMQQRWARVVIGDSSFRSLMEHIESAESAREDWVSKGGDPPRLERELRLDSVTFSYDGGAPVLNDVTASIRPGSFVAIVGPSGSGKSTLTDLITGLLRPTDGRILVDDVDLSETDVLQWRRRIGYVPQESMLFSDTIRANISLGESSVTTEQVEAALTAASAWDFVSRLDGASNHRIGEEGTSLSGGQRQRLAIARALVTNPRLLILDEPTTALDAQSEQEVLRAVQALKGQLTILAISHQPAIRDLADEVWTVDGGTITVDGHTNDGI